MVENARCTGLHTEITHRKGLQFNFTQSKVEPSEGEHSFKMYPLSSIFSKKESFTKLNFNKHENLFLSLTR